MLFLKDIIVVDRFISLSEMMMDPPVPCSPTCEVASLTEGAPRILLMGQTGYCI